MNLISELKNISIDRLNIEETIVLSCFGQQLAGTYSAYEVPVPTWLVEANATLAKEIKSKHRDMLAARLSEAKSRFDSLKTAEEKRADLAKEIEHLSGLLKE